MNKKLNIGVWTQLNWAYGRLYSDIQKYSGHNIQLFDWMKWYPEEHWKQFDLIYIPIWYTARQFTGWCPNIDKRKIIFSVQGVAELFNRVFEGDAKYVKITQEIIEKKEIPDDIINYFKQVPLISAVSQELYDLLTGRGLKNIILTQHGIDLEVFIPIHKDIEHTRPLKIIYHLRRGQIPDHGYNKNRGWMVEEIEERLGDKFDFIFPEKEINYHDMPKFYDGDIYLCVSHSEGGPMSPLEAGACGLITISTDVGNMPQFIKDGETGYLIKNTDEEIIIDQFCEKLIFLDKNRDILSKMKENVLEEIKKWSWEHKIKAWDDFFESACHKHF